jgi:transposase-like protein
MAEGAFERLNAVVLESLLAGASVADTAVEHGVAARTIERWLSKGRENPDSKYGPFAAAVDEQRAEREIPTEAMTAAEFRQSIDNAVRKGSIPAMRLWSELYLGEVRDEPEDTTSKIASLAERRRARSAS